MRRLLVCGLLGLAVLAGCDRRDAPRTGETPEAAPASDFRHRLSGDISGDYRPVEAPSGDWRVEGLFIGQAAAFEAWEAGRRDASPLILTVSGPQGTTRILPRRYDLTDDRLHLVGTLAGGGGQATLDARIDQGALATARRNLGDRTPVVVGAVTVEGRRLPFSLGWWNGD